MRNVKAVTVVLIPAMLVCLGCGGGPGVDVGTVEGTVTLDGAPLPDATVTFQPQGGRASIGITDASGHYELIFSRDAKGAVLGKHTVSITTLQEGDADEGVEAVPEKVPAKYNSKTELTKDVVAGKNEFDFELSSEGEIEAQSED